jgi:ribosome-binding factor A
MSHRKERFSSTLKHCLADIMLMEMNNPLFKSIYITDVVAAGDLKKATVFVSSALVTDIGDVDALISQLTKAKGFFKRNLAKRMVLKYIPELVFIYEGNGK